MELREYTIEYPSKASHFHIIGVGDIHLGGVGCDKERLQEILDYIKNNDHCYWIGMGDYLESINPDDKRFDPHSIDPEYDIPSLSNLLTTQVEDMIEFFKPIAHRCIGLLAGNHEEKVRLRYYRDVVYDLCKELKVQYLGYSAFVRLRTVRKTKDTMGTRHIYTIFACHGYGAARKAGASVNRLVDVAHSFDADIIMLAHEHKKVASPPILKLSIQKVDELKLFVKKQVAVNTGSFMKGYVVSGKSYVERAMYPPTDLGVVKITVEPFKRNIHCSV